MGGIIISEFPRAETVLNCRLKTDVGSCTQTLCSPGGSSSPMSWAAAKASSRESPRNLLLVFMQWPVRGCIQYGYCSACQGCQLVAGVKMRSGFGRRIFSAYHCVGSWRNVQTVSGPRGWG